MANDIDHVKARFGGEDITFRIARTDLPLFETTMKKPAYALFRTLQSGHWTIDDVRGVLRFAALTDDQLGKCRGVAVLGVGVNFDAHGVSVPLVDRTLVERPPAKYALLAMWILGAALFGISVAEASFDEDRDAGE